MPLKTFEFQEKWKRKKSFAFPDIIHQKLLFNIPKSEFKECPEPTATCGLIESLCLCRRWATPTSWSLVWSSGEDDTLAATKTKIYHVPSPQWHIGFMQHSWICVSSLEAEWEWMTGQLTRVTRRTCFGLTLEIGATADLFTTTEGGWYETGEYHIVQWQELGGPGGIFKGLESAVGGVHTHCSHTLNMNFTVDKRSHFRVSAHFNTRNSIG